MPEAYAAPRTAAPMQIEYRRVAADVSLPADTLAVFGFGAACELPSDPRCVRVGLTPLRGAGHAEIWRGSGAVELGRDGEIRYACDGRHLCGVIELDERRHGGIGGAAEAAYTAIRTFEAGSEYRYVLRLWNYCDAINQGEGDAERYKQFCVGRAAGMGARARAWFPAATAIGRRDGDPMVQVYWLAARTPGVPLENPRQLSAFRYPRQYGPASPSFSRAMLTRDPMLLISGTASVVGHVSHHPGNVAAQIRETLLNLQSVLERAAGEEPTLPREFGPTSTLKVYLRDAAHLETVDALLAQRLAAGTRYLVLEGDICRRDLLVEIDGIHLPSTRPA